MNGARPADLEGPREVFVEIYADYDDDHPQRLRELLAAVGAVMDQGTLLSRDDCGIHRRIRVSAPDLGTWQRARRVFAEMRGLTVTSEEESIAIGHPNAELDAGSSRRMTRNELVSFLRTQRLAVQASTHASGAPQAAVVGFAVTDQLEIVFDTLTTSRKYMNLCRDPRCALVVGWDDEITAQIEGIADEPNGTDLDRLKTCYFETYPDGRLRASSGAVAYLRVRPTWVRYSDFRRAQILTFAIEELS